MAEQSLQFVQFHYLLTTYLLPKPALLAFPEKKLILVQLIPLWV